MKKGSSGKCVVALLWLVFAMVWTGDVTGEEARDLAKLEILNAGYPRAFFFRTSEGYARTGRYTYENWEPIFRPLNGIMGKVLDEEVPGTSERNIEYFTRFKRDHPEKVVLLHFNGNARDPLYETGDFFAGHWVYYSGTKLTQPLAAEDGEAIVQVADPSLFRVNTGRYRNRNDDIGIAMIGPDGKPNWHISEQVQLLGIDRENKTIRVRRGAYGTRPLAFPVGSYIAAHVAEGPWGEKSNLLWFYNYATVSPRNRAGLSAADVLIDDLAGKFAPEGILGVFDGIEFDVLFFDQFGRDDTRGPDTNADGIADWGRVDGVNVYGIGVNEFLEKLRSRLGENVIITADGHSARHQRGFGLLNGIESEGWPSLQDYQVVDWSGGLNRHKFWTENSHHPSFSYVNHKFTKQGELIADLPFSTTRLVLAAAQFADSIVTFSLAPAKGLAEIGVWDELRKGVEWEPNWLGMPRSEAVHLAAHTPDLLSGAGQSMGNEMLERLSGEDVAINMIEDRVLRVSSTNAEADRMQLKLSGLQLTGPDLFVQMDVKADALVAYPGNIGRLLQVRWEGAAGGPADLLSEPFSTGMAYRGQPEGALVPTSGAKINLLPRVDIENETRPVMFVHPPYQGGYGYAYWSTRVKVSRSSSNLVFYTGIRPRPGETDGVTFKVVVREEGKPGVTVFAEHQSTYAYKRHLVDLSPWIGREMELQFISDVGPADNSVADHSVWGSVLLVGQADGGPEEKDDRGTKEAMTWANDKWFTASFYFRNAGPGPVDLAMDVEGTEPLYVRNVTVHSAPDVMVREFDNGVVLANPSTRPQMLQMNDLFPNVKLRRLDGSPGQETLAGMKGMFGEDSLQYDRLVRTLGQDPLTNDGSLVGDSLILLPMDGLFLVRCQE